MNWMNIYLGLTIAAFLVFTIYNIVAIHIFGMPSSLSDTYYLYESKKKNLGWIFSIMMWLMAGLLMPAWLGISDAIGFWESNLRFSQHVQLFLSDVLQDSEKSGLKTKCI